MFIILNGINTLKGVIMQLLYDTKKRKKASNNNGSEDGAIFRFYIGKIVMVSLMIMMPVLTIASQSTLEEPRVSHVATFVNSMGEQLPHAESMRLADVGVVAEEDSLALVALYHSAEGDYWRDDFRAGWLTTPVATWPGVRTVANVGSEAEPEWRIIDFRKTGFTMTRTGTLPPEIGNMVYLERLEIRNNLFSGPIPVQVANMDRLGQYFSTNNLQTGAPPWEEIVEKLKLLRQIDIKFNFHTGTLPPAVGGFESLTSLLIEANYFDGELPSELGNISTLLDFDARSNGFTGEIPDFSRVNEPRRFYFGNNDFNPGPVPEWLGEESVVENLQDISLEYTNRTGEFPEFMLNYPRFRSLFIGNPGFMTEIPDLSGFPELRRLEIYGIDYTGPIPEWIGEMPGLVHTLVLYDIGFTGELPGNLVGDVARRITLEKLRNVTGGIPEAWASNDTFYDLHLIDNTSMEVGNIPAWLSNYNWRSLYLENVGVTGEIPAWFVDQSDLERLSLRGNPGVTGTLPAWLIGSEQNIRTIDVSGTGITVDEFPAWLADFANLEDIGLAGTGMSGSIPDWLGTMRDLRMVDLSNNALTGPIPATLGDAVYLDSLNLSNNQLSGELPENLGNAGRTTELVNSITSFSISGNPDLTGTLPMGFLDANFLRVLEFEGTQVCPPDMTYQEWINNLPDRAAEFYLNPISINYENRSYRNIHVSVKDNWDYCKDVLPTSSVVETPYIFRLEQNFPNPFNPATIISYEIPADVHVELRVYNILGQLVSTLVSGSQSAGRHQVNFDASGLASGSYVYRLVAGDRSMSQSMMIVK